MYRHRHHYELKMQLESLGWKGIVVQRYHLDFGSVLEHQLGILIPVLGYLHRNRSMIIEANILRKNGVLTLLKEIGLLAD